MNREQQQFIPNQQGIDANIQEERKSEDSQIYSDHQSLSFISKSKGGLIQNPDGTLLIMKPVSQADYLKIQDNLKYGINGDQDDQISNESSELSFLSLPQNQVLLPLYSSPAHPFFIPAGTLPQFVDQLIELYIKHNIIFTVYLFVQLVIEGVFKYLQYQNKEKAIKNVNM